jgi:hypothetical protein
MCCKVLPVLQKEITASFYVLISGVKIVVKVSTAQKLFLQE